MPRGARRSPTADVVAQLLLAVPAKAHRHECPCYRGPCVGHADAQGRHEACPYVLSRRVYPRAVQIREGA
jgi:hypothetical protein